MRLNEFFLTERIVNLHTAAEKAKYVDEVWDILQKSYERLGGFKTASSPEELIKKSGMWKLTVRDGNVTAVVIGRNQFGRKLIATGTDQTIDGKKDFLMMKRDDVRLKRFWAEASGAVEHFCEKFGAVPIPSKYAEVITKHPIVSYDEDGYHYIRLIDGNPHRKIMFGTVKLTPDELELLTAAGLDLNELPENFQRI